MTVFLEIITNKILRYVSHPIVNIMYRISTSTDIGAILRANDKVFWARNSSKSTMKDVYEFVPINMNGCIHVKFNQKLR